MAGYQRISRFRALTKWLFPLLAGLVLVLSMPQQATALAAPGSSSGEPEDAPMLASTSDLTVDPDFAAAEPKSGAGDFQLISFSTAQPVVLGAPAEPGAPQCRAIVNPATRDPGECLPANFTDQDVSNVERCLNLGFDDRDADAQCSRPEIASAVSANDNANSVCDWHRICDPRVDVNAKVSCWDAVVGSSLAGECAGGVVDRVGKVGEEVFSCGTIGGWGGQEVTPEEKAYCDSLAANNAQAIDENLNPITIIIDNIKESIYNMISDAFKSSMQWLTEVAFSSDATIFNPVLSCDNRSDQDVACQPWFQQQFDLMAKVGLWIVLPLMMLIVIQSVVRGSLFMLLRSALIMLPAAILGTVAITTVAQLLINISDDFCEFILSLTFNDAELQQVVDGFMNLDDQATTGGLFQILFFFVTIIGIIVIFIELMLREVGVYLSTLFLPLAFAGLVWPASARWARRLVELLIGLIFSKVFIVAALSLGFSAIAAMGSGGTEASVQSMATLLATLAVAIVAPSKMWAFVPGGREGMEGRVASPSNIASKGDPLSMVLGKRQDHHAAKITKLAPDGRNPFKNS